MTDAPNRPAPVSFGCALSGADREAAVRALVVDQSCRRAGIARALMAEAERWGQKHGCRSVVLSSNLVREPAHAFYRALGYRVAATAHVFRKPISEGGGHADD